jgi:hypothetical protein
MMKGKIWRNDETYCVHVFEDQNKYVSSLQKDV